MFTSHQVQRVGIEGSGSFGRAVAVHLALRWQSDQPVAVVEVPTLMTSRERHGQLGKGKTDPVDALAVARITAREQQLPTVRLTVGAAADLRALLDYREDLVRERGALVNRAHAELGGLRPGYQQQIPILTTRARVRAAVDLLSDDSSIRATLCRRRLERVIAIDAETAELKRQIGELVAAADTTLTDLYGVGPLVAARFIAEVVDIRRYPNRNAFAAANGTAPLPPPQVAPSGTGSIPAGTASSTGPSTRSRSPRSRRYRRPRLLRTQTRRRQVQTRSAPLPQTATVRHRVHHHAPRRRQRRRIPRPASPSAWPCWLEWVRSTQMRPD